MQVADRAKGRSLFFDDLLDARVREFRPPSLLPRPEIPFKQLPILLRHGRILELHAGKLFSQRGDVGGGGFALEQFPFLKRRFPRERVAQRWRFPTRAFSISSRVCFPGLKPSAAAKSASALAGSPISA